jgi:hypothetical protein
MGSGLVIATDPLGEPAAGVGVARGAGAAGALEAAGAGEAAAHAPELRREKRTARRPDMRIKRRPSARPVHGLSCRRDLTVTSHRYR